ncbi:complement regulator-acquiring protein (plasmid) [Borreliella garinii]|uniref:complement regulator-acquiring protein n=1 Tax=Borreliella garinii TaxID=29519 RepID=UPI00292FCA3C|nr:complement regulator-acquiring protein [Borreliella garinii]WNZ72222.1 complement regulator-acquiring protein [Borreliella garinii]
MKKNKLIAIFLLHILTGLILLSCSLEVNQDDNQEKQNKKAKTKISKNENNSSKMKKLSKNAKNKKTKDNLLGAINNVGNLPRAASAAALRQLNNALAQPNNALAQLNNALAQPNNANALNQIADPEVIELIQKILERSEDIVQISETDFNRGEPDDQFEMRADIFSQIFFNADSIVTFDDNEYLNERRILYTSLNFNEDTILNLGRILSKLSKDPNYRSLVKETLINRGFSIQLAIEEISLRILNVRDKLQHLNKPNLRTLYYDFNQLIPLKEKWLEDVDDIIRNYNADPELRNDISKLNAYIMAKNSREQFSNIHNIILNLMNTTTNILTPIQ